MDSHGFQIRFFRLFHGFFGVISGYGRAGFARASMGVFKFLNGVGAPLACALFKTAVHGNNSFRCMDNDLFMISVYHRNAVPVFKLPLHFCKDTQKNVSLIDGGRSFPSDILLS